MPYLSAACSFFSAAFASREASISAVLACNLWILWVGRVKTGPVKILSFCCFGLLPETIGFLFRIFSSPFKYGLRIRMTATPVWWQCPIATWYKESLVIPREHCSPLGFAFPFSILAFYTSFHTFGEKWWLTWRDDILWFYIRLEWRTVSSYRPSQMTTADVTLGWSP